MIIRQTNADWEAKVERMKKIQAEQKELVSKIVASTPKIDENGVNDFGSFMSSMSNGMMENFKKLAETNIEAESLGVDMLIDVLGGKKEAEKFVQSCYYKK
jgi:hypothetical protein